MTRTANATAATRRSNLLDRIQSEDFVRYWRNHGRDMAFARLQITACGSFMPFKGHRTCADWLNPSVAPRDGSAAPRFPGAAHDAGEDRAGASSSPVSGGS